MSRLERIIEIGFLGKTLVQKSMYRHLLPRLAGIPILSIITGMMLFSVLLGLFCLGYHVMIWNGVANNDAALVTAIVFIGITLLMVFCTIRAIRYARHDLSPFPKRLHAVANAFLDGFEKRMP